MSAPASYGTGLIGTEELANIMGLLGDGVTIPFQENHGART